MNKTNTDGWWRKIVTSVQKINNPFNGLFDLDLPDDFVLKMATEINPLNGLESPEYYFKLTPNRIYIILKGGNFERVVADVPGHFINDPDHKFYDENKREWETLAFPENQELEYRNEKYSFIKDRNIRKRCERLGLIYLGGKPGIYKILEWKMSWTELINNMVVPRPNQLTNHYRFKYQYYTIAEARTGAVIEKDNEMIPVAIKVLYTLQINNGYLFRFNADNALEVIDEKIESTIRDIVGGQTIDWLNATKHESDENGLSKKCEKILNDHEEVQKLGVKILDITYIGFDFSGPNKQKLAEMFETARLSKEKAEAMQNENVALFGKLKAENGFLTNLNDMPDVADKYYQNKNTELMAEALKETNASVIVLGGNNSGIGNAITAAEAAKHTSKKPNNTKHRTKK